MSREPKQVERPERRTEEKKKRVVGERWKFEYEGIPLTQQPNRTSNNRNATTVTTDELQDITWNAESITPLNAWIVFNINFCLRFSVLIKLLPIANASRFCLGFYFNLT